MNITLDEMLERATRAFEPPVYYWLGEGGRFDPDDTRIGPGDPAVDLAAKFEALRRSDPVRAARIEAKARAAGLDAAPAGRVPACDCSNFSNWVLRIPHGARDWMNTDAMHADAGAANGVFELFDRANPRRAAPGALLVYPKPPDESFGHVGIVTKVTPAGLPERVVHCSADNFLTQGHAIAATGPEEFFRQPKALVIWCRRVPR